MAKKINCWEALKCGKTKCPAYHRHDYNCWLVSDTLCYDDIQGEFRTKINLCLSCKVFYKKATIPSMRESLKILSQQLAEYEKRLKEQRSEMGATNKDISTALVEILNKIEGLFKGDDAARLNLNTNNQQLIKLASKLNLFAEDNHEIVEQSRKLTSQITGHCEALNSIAGGDFSVKALEDSKNELSVQLGRQIDKAVITLLKLIKDQILADDKHKSYIQNLRDIIEFLPDPTFIIDNEKKIIGWNRAIEKLTDTKKADMIGKGDYAYAIPFYGYKRPILIDLLNEPNEEFERTYEALKRESHSLSGEIYIPSFKQGKGIYIWATATPLFDGDGKKIGAIESIRDITEFKENEKMVMDVNEKLRLWADELEQKTRELGILNEMSELIQTCKSIDEAYAVISQTLLRLFPAFSGCIYMFNNSTTQFDCVSTWGDEIRGENTFKSHRCLALRRGRMHVSKKAQRGARCKHLLKEFSGDYICIPLIAHGDSIGLLHLQLPEEQSTAFKLEMTESRQHLAITIAEHISLYLYNIKLRETLSYQAIRDPLTELFNRRYMEETLKRELQRARRSKSTVGLIMFDIDHFKRFNDTFGHEAGDAMLHQIALFIKSNIRAEDIASRYGGEEFLITMPDASVSVTKDRAEKLRQEVKNLHVEHGRQHLGNVTLSFGVAVFPANAQNWELLIKAADTALYKAKAEGRDKVVVAE